MSEFVRVDIWHHRQEQAFRPVPQRIVQDVSFISHLAPFSITCLGTGKMPVPQENSFFVERASCPLLTMVQDVSFILLSAFYTADKFCILP
ncbi:hypothetical protein QUB36_23710 [Microcoleus sp. AT8-B1]|uniref:hypothetical protein n=1 Tax=unclassified Microcoleus TaxID=2642155 RepID=UPI002FD36A7F